MPAAVSMTWPQYRRRECTFEGRPVHLSPQECEVMTALLMRRGCFVTRDDLIQFLWPDPDCEIDSASFAIGKHICWLRRKMPGIIMTAKTRGYMIERPRVTMPATFRAAA